MTPEATRYTFTIPRPSYPDEPEYVHVVARRGAWDRGPIVAWNIVRSCEFWTRARDGFAYRPDPTEAGRWTLAEALVEAEEHAVPFVEAMIRDDEEQRRKVESEK